VVSKTDTMVWKKSSRWKMCFVWWPLVGKSYLVREFFVNHNRMAIFLCNYEISWLTFDHCNRNGKYGIIILLWLVINKIVTNLDISFLKFDIMSKEYFCAQCRKSFKNQRGLLYHNQRAFCHKVPEKFRFPLVVVAAFPIFCCCNAIPIVFAAFPHFRFCTFHYLLLHF
jgi:hypothetical protein